MNELEQRFITAIAGQLAAAPDGPAKDELVEELADNLYHRYLDMTAAGVAEDEAFRRAMDDLGDVDELVDYLKGLAPDEDIPKLTLYPDELEEIIRGAMGKARDALAAAQNALWGRDRRHVTVRSDDGTLELHLDPDEDDDHGEHPLGEDHEEDEPRPSGRKDLIYGVGYDKSKGGFFAQWGEWKGERTEGDRDETIGEEGIPSQGLRGLEIQSFTGDVTIRLSDDENAPIRLEDYDGLEIKRTDDNVLSISQGSTASASFFFRRGILASDVDVTIPRRAWEFLHITTVTGDVTLEDGVQAERISVKTTSGDLRGDEVDCRTLHLTSASGDCTLSGSLGLARAETMSGDLSLHARAERVQLNTMSGDVELSGALSEGRITSMSGDLRLESSVLPRSLELSTKSGDCHLRIPADRGFTLRHKTTSGDLRSSFPLTGTPNGLVYLDGGEATFSVSTVSGDIRLRKF